MGKQQFVKKWSDRVGWALELFDYLLAAITIVLAVVVVFFILLGWNNLFGLIAALIAGLLLFVFAFNRIAWLFGITLGWFLLIPAGIILGAISARKYGGNDDAE